MFIGVNHKGFTVVDQRLVGTTLEVEVDKYPNKWFTYDSFLKGCITESIPSKHIGKSVDTRYGKLTILSVDNQGNAVVKFDNGFTTTAKAHQALSGYGVKNPLYPTVHGKGLLGIGEYSSTNSPAEYGAWAGVLNRSGDVKVCKEWYDFQVFCKWHKEERFKRDNPDCKLLIEKDISGNTEYSPDASFLVPPDINNLFTVQKMQKLVPLPMGVTAVKGGKFKATISFNMNKEVIGVYDNPILASEAYYKRKAENWILAAEIHRKELCVRGYEAILHRASKVLS